ncbi:MAG: hypothetical protein EBS90_13845, partial [Betaproteobacteria bacterium]|nr:hypothetical protein [Betaproteobacteria bacterium]
MAILVEAISVVARRDRLDELFPGGAAQYINDCPNTTACADSHLVRIGFMDTDAVRAHVRRMESLGFVHLDSEGKAQDLVVVDQLQGLVSKCEWLEYGHVTIQEDRIAVARLVGDSTMTMFTPPGWTFEGSLTQKHRFVPDECANTQMKFLEERDGQYVYFDLQSGRRLYSLKPPSSEQLAHMASIQRLQELASLHLRRGEYDQAASASEEGAQMLAREIVAAFALMNSFEAPLSPEPADHDEAWTELACYAAAYATALNADLKAFVFPTPESARAEAASRQHGGLYWEDITDPDGIRSRHYL